MNIRYPIYEGVYRILTLMAYYCFPFFLMINGSIVSVTDYADKSKRAKERRETRCDKS